MTYIIFLSFKFLTEVELLSLQPHEWLPQFFGFIPKEEPNCHYKEIHTKNVSNYLLLLNMLQY